MNTNCSKAITKTIFGLIAATGTQLIGFDGVAQPATKPSASTTSPAPASQIPVHAGEFVGEKVDTITYKPTCPAFIFDMDAAAIQESTSRAYVEGEKRRYEQAREKWDAYEDCLTENGRRDIEAIRTKLGDYLSNQADEEVKLFNALNAAATANIDRITKLPPSKPAKKKSDSAVAETPQVTLSTWTEPTGRFVGTIKGSAAAPEYVTGCPKAIGALTVESFATESTRNGFNAKLEELRALPQRINQVRTCRQENGQDDYEAVQKAVQDGFNAVFQPSKAAFEREYANVRFQLNEHQKPGGLLAPPELSRGNGKKKPTVPKAKKK
ncbi:hypothetical protein [Candidatus Phycosocius spiralis]|uniref:Uncharacterized protein n=1 Tax=Candidatus Phycosocius spiralis TaxID=2815099 RepID=A0ABQ4PYV3_9PROT|nr:hypothetical protein [Candidatus Phycosocius spiralis]GIU68106.1 hypothetical protein PsB1_2260 [Candidatus Phycosocius spiralis]